MSNTNALTGYRRIIPAKFSTRRDGTPVTCRYCARPIVAGADFAAVDATGEWHNVCTTCAASEVAQVAGLVTQVEARAASLSEEAQGVLMSDVAQVEGDVARALAGEVAVARVTVPKLLSLLASVDTINARIARESDPNNARIGALRTVLVNLTGRDLDFAVSLVSQYDKRGSLSDKQWPFVDSLTVKGTPGGASVAAGEGFYLVDGNDVVLVYRTRNGNLASKTMGKHDQTFTYTGRAGISRVEAGMVPNPHHTTEKLTHQQAASFGQASGKCMVCLAHGHDPLLTDDRSIAAGYGPVCAVNQGWPYPSADEAAEILRQRRAIDPFEGL